MKTELTPTMAAVDQPRLVRRFRVRGICFVPCDLELEIEAESEEKAVREALTCPWKQSIDGNSMDAGAAFDWRPTAEEINPANATGHATADNNQPTKQ